MWGELDAAERRFERLLSFSSPPGLFSEEVDPVTGGLLEFSPGVQPPGLGRRRGEHREGSETMRLCTEPEAERLLRSLRQMVLLCLAETWYLKTVVGWKASRSLRSGLPEADRERY